MHSRGNVHSFCSPYRGGSVRQRCSAERRVKEHRAHLEHGRLEQSAVAKHVMTEGHAVHWEPFIVEREQDQTRRRVLEALAIHRVEKDKGTMNTDNGMQISMLWLDLAV